ncbi:MAG: stage II sporulation protein P, partial [Clostridia bacterium]|nr:stage II sporulation protein P [Clostridia bacterium]
MGRKIFFFFSFILLSAASVYCLNFVCSHIVFTGVSAEIASSASENFNRPQKNFAESEKTLPQSSVPSSSATQKSDSSLPTTASGTAKGKIVTKTITATAANLKYQKIYVKNQTGLSVNLKAELLTLPKLKIATTKEPQVLIVHTHSTECYMNEERNYYTSQDQTRTTD